jgi:hypothetical protein
VVNNFSALTFDCNVRLPSYSNSQRLTSPTDFYQNVGVLNYGQIQIVADVIVGIADGIVAVTNIAMDDEPDFNALGAAAVRTDPNIRDVYIY